MTKPKLVGCPYHSVREDPGSPNKAGTVGVSSPFHSFRDEDSSQLRAGLTGRMTQKQRPWLLLQVVQKGLWKLLMSLTENALG